MDEEQNQFQQDLLASVREMKAGRALPPAQIKNLSSEKRWEAHRPSSAKPPQDVSQKTEK